jgi:hypothetical protein
MSINFITNDPDAGSTAPGLHSQSARQTRPSGRSGFTLTGSFPQGNFPPGTPQFLFWQSREAAIAAVQAWEASSGPHTRWQGNRSKLPLLPDAGVDLNAFYDRASFSFFHKTLGAATFFSGESTDVVAHEVGHGLVDSIRPDFFSVNFLEVAAFHEAAGDCVAILTALNDLDTRKKLLAITTTLKKKNFVESTAEQLSRAIGIAFPGHNASESRHAFNKFQFQLPQTLPSNGGPGALINEAHSFGMLFSGCFWDLIGNIFADASAKTPASLLTAAQTAGRILIAGTKGALIAPRFLQSVGRAMVLADQSLHSGANRERISAAFQSHSILLGANAMVAPSIDLAGPAPKGASLAAATKRDLMKRLGAGRGARMATAAIREFDTPMVSVTHTDTMPLSSIPGLKGVVAEVHQPVLVGASGRTAAVMGPMPHPENSEAEVLAYVKTLVEHDRIDFGREKKSGAKKRGMVAGGDAAVDPTTHVIKRVGGKKMLQRVRFLCGAGCSHR